MGNRDGSTVGGERTLILSRLGSPGILELLKCDAVLWLIGSLGAGRIEKKTTPNAGQKD